MQQYFNALKWKVPTKFSHFESIEGRFESRQYATYSYEDAFCYGGYVTETSPQGIKVCEATIKYTYNSTQGRYQDWTSNDSCRWR